MSGWSCSFDSTKLFACVAKENSRDFAEDFIANTIMDLFDAVADCVLELLDIEFPPSSLRMPDRRRDAAERAELTRGVEHRQLVQRGAQVDGENE